MPRFRWLVAVLAISGVSRSIDAARADTGPAVPGFERASELLADDPAEAGRLLLAELNCLACHSGGPAAMDGFGRKQAPDLSEVASRVRLDYLRAMIADPQHAKPGTTMPRMPLEPESERSRKVEAIVHFLAEGSYTVADELPDRKAAERGRRLFTEVGCAGCHDPIARKAGKPLPGSIPLGKLAAKYSVDSLAQFLRDPLAVRHSGRMPSLNLSQQEARDVASALVEGIELPPNVRYRVYPGDFEQLPEFSKLKPAAAGQSVGFDLAAAKLRNNFAIQFEGYLHLEKPGAYKFYLTSEDGARLLIDGRTIVANDGLHPATEKEADKNQLAAGPHRVLLEYFDRGGDTELAVEFESRREVPRQGLAASMSLERDGPAVQRLFRADPKLAAEGARLFASAGCAACHVLKRGENRIASQLSVPRFDRLRLDRGCLADEPPPAAPRYGLTGVQRAALRQALTATKASIVTPETVIARTMATFNCDGCHVRGGRGGVPPARNDFFATTAREMGDEARIPPTLDGVGAKLTEGYLKRVLDRGAKDRPYMLTRMPRFGGGNVGHLAPLFAAVDKQRWPPLAKLDLPEYRIKSDGRMLVGGRAFSCIKCHNFGKYAGEGIQAIDMTTMTQRLRPEWFGRYVRDPAGLRPGTRMPAAWPKTGRSMLRDVLGGDCDRQIAAVWAYLSDGRQAAAPFGVGGQPIELVPDKEPIVYRNFIAGAGPRGIAVGYPEKVNLAIDGNQLQLVLVWRGPFIDASRHWSGRSEGFQGPLGDHVLPLAGGVPLAQFGTPEQPWPQDPAKALGYQFEGYDFDAQRRPTFHYHWRQLHVDDFYEPQAQSAGAPDLERTLELAGTLPGSRVFFRAARAQHIEPASDGWFSVDKSWSMRVRTDGGAEYIVRRSGGEMELLVPVELTGGRQTIRQTIRW